MTVYGGETVKNDSANDVIDDVTNKQDPGVVRQLLDISSALSRFITLEYFSDGAALSQAFRSR